MRTLGIAVVTVLVGCDEPARYVDRPAPLSDDAPAAWRGACPVRPVLIDGDASFDGTVAPGAWTVGCNLSGPDDATQWTVTATRERHIYEVYLMCESTSFVASGVALVVTTMPFGLWVPMLRSLVRPRDPLGTGSEPLFDDDRKVRFATPSWFRQRWPVSSSRAVITMRWTVGDFGP